MIVYKGNKIRYRVPKDEDFKNGPVTSVAPPAVMRVRASLRKHQGKGPLKRGLHCKACDRPIEQDPELCSRCQVEAETVFPKKRASSGEEEPV